MYSIAGPNMPSGVKAPVEGRCFGLDDIVSAPCLISRCGFPDVRDQRTFWDRGNDLAVADRAPTAHRRVDLSPAPERRKAGTITAITAAHIANNQIFSAGIHAS
jgi:hypothetical protein